MKVSWYCGMFVGPSRWIFSGDWVYEPEECYGEGEFECTPEEWRKWATKRLGEKNPTPRTAPT